MEVETIVLGIGNLLLRDEGAGVHAIRALEESFNIPPGLQIVDGGTMGLDLLPYIEGKDKLLIVDAVDFKSPPGTIKTLEDSGIKKFLDLKFSVHQIGLPEMLFAAQLKDILPPHLCLVGIQPEVIETGLELSDTVAAQLDDLVQTMVKKLQEWGIEIKEKENVPGNPV